MAVQSFANRVLDGLGREYQVVGSISRTDKMDLGPISLVHDVSENVRGSMWIPICGSNLTSIVIGAALTEGFFDISRAAFLAATPAVETLALLRLQPSEADIWVFGVSAVVLAADVANFSRFQVGVRMAQSPGGAGQVRQLIAYSAADANLTAAATIVPLLSVGAASGLADTIFHPFLLADHGNSGFVGRAISGAGGGMTVQAFVHCYLGPKGSIPPAV